MKAPDKIYTDNRGVYAKLPIFSQADANVEYIRKDTLIECLEVRKKDIISKIIPGAEDPVMYGKLNMCKEIINKLNDM